MSDPSTSYRVGDTAYNLVAKILRKLSGSPRPGDTEEGLWRKIVTELGGTSKPADMRFDSLLKILRLLDPVGFCQCGDTEYDLLWDIVLMLGGIPSQGDLEFDLLRKALEQIVGIEGEPCMLLMDGSELFLAGRNACLLLLTS